MRPSHCLRLVKYSHSYTCTPLSVEICRASCCPSTPREDSQRCGAAISAVWVGYIGTAKRRCGDGLGGRRTTAGGHILIRSFEFPSSLLTALGARSNQSRPNYISQKIAAQKNAAAPGVKTEIPIAGYLPIVAPKFHSSSPAGGSGRERATLSANPFSLYLSQREQKGSDIGRRRKGRGVQRAWRSLGAVIRLERMAKAAGARVLPISGQLPAGQKRSKETKGGGGEAVLREAIIGERFIHPSQGVISSRIAQGLGLSCNWISGAGVFFVSRGNAAQLHARFINGRNGPCRTQ